MSLLIKKVDIFVQSATLPKLALGAEWKLVDIFNRGTSVWPEGKISCHMTDVYQCRVEWAGKSEVKRTDVAKLLMAISEAGVVWSNIHLVLE